MTRKDSVSDWSVRGNRRFRGQSVGLVRGNRRFRGLSLVVRGNRRFRGHSLLFIAVSIVEWLGIVRGNRRFRFAVELWGFVHEC